MAAFYLDSSAIVKHYVNEAGTAWVQSLIPPAAPNSIQIARIAGVEVVAALARRQRGGSISVSDAAIAITDFRHDFDHTFRVIAMTPKLLYLAMDMAEKHGLRGYDAVQLAGACAVHVRRSLRRATPLVFVSADAGLNAAAQNEGLAVDDPNLHP